MALVRLGPSEEPANGNVKITCKLCGASYAVPESEENNYDGFVCPECVAVQNSETNNQTKDEIAKATGN